MGKQKQISEITFKYLWGWHIFPGIFMDDDNFAAMTDYCMLTMEASPPYIKNHREAPVGSGLRDRLSITCRLDIPYSEDLSINDPYVSAQVVKLLTVENAITKEAIDKWADHARTSVLEYKGVSKSKTTDQYVSEGVAFFEETIRKTHADLVKWWNRNPERKNYPEVMLYCGHRYYLSGPVTGHPDYMENFAAAEQLLQNKGFYVVNPTKVNAVLPEYTLYENFMHVCFSMMDFCDTIVMLPGWEESFGANRELKRAKERKMRVMYLKDFAI